MTRLADAQRGSQDLSIPGWVRHTLGRIAETDRNKRFHRLPEVVERIVFQSMRMDYDKRQR